MRTKMSTADKIRRMLAKGYSPKQIATKLDCKTQLVYNVRYQDRQKMGLGSLLPTATAPVAPKRPRGRPRKVRVDPMMVVNPIVIPRPDSSSLPPPPPLTLWQRIKARIKSWL